MEEEMMVLMVVVGRSFEESINQSKTKNLKTQTS
jgi:hypothetical protein